MKLSNNEDRMTSVESDISVIKQKLVDLEYKGEPV